MSDEQRKKDDQTRIDEIERRMMTGEVHPVQRRLLELIEGHTEKTVPLPLPKS